MNTGWAPDDRETLPDLESIVPGSFLAVVLEHVDRERLNGHDVVRLLQARERQLAHLQAGSMADTVETAYSAPGGADSLIERLDEPFEYASDEIRAALTLTRRSAEYRLSMASDIIERLPRVWDMLSQGLIDYPRARVFADGTCHVPEDAARSVVRQLAELAPKLTVSQLKARISKLCVSADPEDAAKREKTAHEDRAFMIEPLLRG
jgi:hypothetical protein